MEDGKNFNGVIFVTKAKNKSKNLLWKEIYGAILACRLNILEISPAEYLTVSLNGEPLITKNMTAIQQTKYLATEIRGMAGRMQN